jgi:hypothetical protein
MQSWDPMKNFPELDGMERSEAEQLRRQTQKKVARQPVIFVGLLVTAAMAAIIVFNVLPTNSVLETAFAGALVGLAVAAYMVLVIKPRMRAEFQAMGLPRTGGGGTPSR